METKKLAEKNGLTCNDGVLALLERSESEIIKTELQSKKVKESSEKEILQVLLYCQNLLPVKERPDKDQKYAMMEFIKSKMGDVYLYAIKEAFNMAVAKEICEGTEMDRQYYFSPALIMNVYSCYKVKRDRAFINYMEKIKQSERLKENKQPTMNEKFDNHKRYLIQMYNGGTFDKVYLISDFGLVNCSFLKKIGLFNFTSEEINLCKELAKEYYNNKHANNPKTLHTFLKNIFIAGSDEYSLFELTTNEFLLGTFFYNLKNTDIDSDALDMIIEGKRDVYLM